jgi:hypothetical protein
MPSVEIIQVLSQLLASSSSEVLYSAWAQFKEMNARRHATDIDELSGADDPARAWRSVAAHARKHATDLDQLSAADDWFRAWRSVAAQRSLGTAGSLIVQPRPVSETPSDALIATQDAYVVRRSASSKHDDAVDDHKSKYLDEWQRRAKQQSEKPPAAMLESLWASGPSWRDIARLLKVSVPAIQKWRAGEKMSTKNFAHLRDFMAAYDTIAANKPEIDVAGWLDVPILSDVPVTPQSLWTDGNPSLFFEYALGEMEPERALDHFDPDWRNRYREDGFETFVGDDGNLGIRVKSR